MKKHNSAFNGIATYLFYRFEIPREQQNNQSSKDVSEVINRYLESEGILCKDDLKEKCSIIQKNFVEFSKWCYKNLKKRGE